MSKNKGFTLIEIVAGFGIVCVLGMQLLPMLFSFTNYYRRQKVHTTCRLLVTDLGLLQSLAYYANRNGQVASLTLEPKGSGYSIYGIKSYKKTVNFAQRGLGDIKIEGLQVARFLPGGVPEQPGSFKIYHVDNTVKKRVYIQPVSGRIVVKDE